MNVTFEKFNVWIKRHKLFALAAPVILLLMVFFVSSQINSMESNSENQLEGEGYNNFLPNQTRELDVQQPNDMYKASQKDSMAALNEKGLFNTIVKTNKENDSLERVLEELNNFSLGETSTILEKTPDQPKDPNSSYVSKKNKAEEKLAYRKLLMEARDERLSRSQDFSVPHTEEKNEILASVPNIKAAIYRDQFILPGDRVKLILKEEVNYKGNYFPKNTFIYATSNIKGSRVLLEISNIKNIPLVLVANDQQDGMPGLHNDRANELLQEFKADVQDQGIDELSNAVGELSDLPMTKNVVRSFGNFFSKKKYRQKDKILLVNGDQVFLISKK